ncbi:MAG: hypothetical protein AAGA77_23645, partial [Bacteroidota bacterium]
MNSKNPISVLGSLCILLSVLFPLAVTGQNDYVLNDKQKEIEVFVVKNAAHDQIIDFKVEYGEKDMPYTIASSCLREVKKNTFSAPLSFVDNQNKAISSFDRSDKNEDELYLKIPNTLIPGNYISDLTIALDTSELKKRDKKKWKKEKKKIHSYTWKIEIEVIDSSQFKIITSPSTNYISNGKPCFLLGFLLPPSKIQRALSFEIQNDSDTTIHFNPLELYLVNKKTNRKLTHTAILTSNKKIIATAGEPTPSEAKLSSDLDISAGIYNGQVVLRSKQKADAKSKQKADSGSKQKTDAKSKQKTDAKSKQKIVPESKNIVVYKDLTLTFRHGPFGALSTMLLGLLIGFIARRVDETKKHGDLLKLLANCKKLIKNLSDDKKATFKKRIDSLKNEVNLAVGSTHLERIEKEIDQLLIDIRKPDNLSPTDLQSWKFQIFNEKRSLSSRTRDFINPDIAQNWFKPIIFIIFLAASVLFAFYKLYVENTTF